MSLLTKLLHVGDCSLPVGQKLTPINSCYMAACVTKYVVKV